MYFSHGEFPNLTDLLNKFYDRIGSCLEESFNKNFSKHGKVTFSGIVNTHHDLIFPIFCSKFKFYLLTFVFSFPIGLKLLHWLHWLYDYT